MKKHLTLGSVIICCLAIAGCSDFDNLTTQYETQTTSETAQNVSVAAAPEEDELETKAEAKVYKKGERGIFGDYSIKVIKTKSEVIKGGKSVSIYMDIKNEGKKPINIDSSYFQLIDSEERVFEPADLVGLSNDPIFMMDSINPGMSLSGKVVFEVPSDVKSATIAMRDNMFDFGGAEYVFFDVGQLK